MLRQFVLLAGLWPSALAAQTDVVGLIESEGLRAAQAELAALPDPSPDERFALGAVQFLGGVELALQTRWRHGTPEALGIVLGMPVMRLPLPENPTPAPFTGSVLTKMFERIEADMTAAAATLDGIGDADAVGLAVPLNALWFDINANGSRDVGEGMAEFWNPTLAFDPLAPLPEVTVRFDTADAAWLSAYAHLLATVSETMLAIDMAPAIDEVLTGAMAMSRYPGQSQFDSYSGIIDGVAVVLRALDGVPDAMRLESARSHALAMIADNRIFWERVGAETDNEMEWIPNPRQTSALRLPFPEETGPRWLAVLRDAEALLEGELLLPYWRVSPAVGLDLRAMIADPPDLDLVGLIHGFSLVPYMKDGRRIDGETLRQFEAMLAGDALLYMVILN